MRGCGYVSGRISVSRFNRRLHALAELKVQAALIALACTNLN